MLGAGAVFVAVGLLFHASLFIWQVVLGYDGKAFWNSDRRFTEQQERERWWVYNQ